MQQLQSTPVVNRLQSKAIQIQAVMHPGDFNCGPHTMLIALCADGSMWVQYFSSGSSNVPTDGLWHGLEPKCDSSPA